MIKELMAGALSAAVLGMGEGGQLAVDVTAPKAEEPELVMEHELSKSTFTHSFEQGTENESKDIIILDGSYSWEEVMSLGKLTLVADISEISSDSCDQMDFGAQIYAAGGDTWNWYSPVEGTRNFEEDGRLWITVDTADLNPDGDKDFCCLGVQFFVNPHGAACPGLVDTYEPSKATVSYTLYSEKELTTSDWREELRSSCPEFLDILRNEQSFDIPGLSSTKTGSSETAFMVPQGICATDDYFIISAYCAGCSGNINPATKYKSKEHTGQHRSVLYVVDKKTRKLLCTLATRDTNHVGGLAYDPDRKLVWIAKSTDNSLDAVSLDTVKDAAKKGGSVSISKYACKDVSCGVTASYLAYDSKNGLLWVGTYSPDESANTIRGFAPSKKDKSYKLTAKTAIISLGLGSTNGMDLLTKDGYRYLAVSSSPGRNCKSVLQLYNISIGKEKNGKRSVSLTKLGDGMSAPNMMEELVSDGGLLYTSYESASNQYYNFSNSKKNKTQALPTEQVCALAIDDYIAEAATIDAADVTLDYSAFTYTGAALDISSYLTVRSGPEKLKLGRDYDLSYKNNKEIGFNSASVTVTGIGRYSGTVTKTFTIKPKKNEISSLTTNEGAIKVKWKKDSTASGYQVLYSKDKTFSKNVYSVTVTDKNYVSLTKKPKVGEKWYIKVRAFITADGTTEGTRCGTYSQVESITAACGIVSAEPRYASYTYSGKEIKPSLIVTDTQGNKVPASDYTVEYKNNKKVGTATVTIKGKNGHYGEAETTFVIKPAPAVLKLKAAKSAFKATWKKNSSATGYEVLYSKDKSFKSGVHSYKTEDVSKLSETFSSVPESGETWYVKYRAFVTIDGKRYGNYSEIKRVKVK